MSSELAPTKAEKWALIGAGHRGVELHSLDDYWRFAQIVEAAGMAPNGITNTAGILIAIQRGAEVGLLPMQALQSIYIVNNMPQLFGDAPKAIVEASGLLEKCKEFEEGKYPEDDFKAVCIVKRRGRDEERRTEFSISDAKRANLWEKKSKEGRPSPWVLYPRRMLQWRARGYALRDEFPDVLKGMPIAELGDDYDGSLSRAKNARGRVVEPSFEGSAPPAAPPKPESKPEKPKPDPDLVPPPPKPPKKSLFADLPAEAPRAKAPAPEPERYGPGAEAPEPSGPAAAVRAKLAQAGYSEDDFFNLLSYAQQIEGDPADYDLSMVKEEHLNRALKEWDFVLKALERKR